MLRLVAVALASSRLLAAAQGQPAPEACAVLPATLTLPESIGLEPAPVAALLQAARNAGTDGFAVLKDGKYIAGFGEQKPILIYSITKPITGIAVGRLFTEGKWTNLDATLSALLPAQFANDPKGVVTMRQLMSHTAGIRDVRDTAGHVMREWNQAKDWVESARKQPFRDPPGAVFRYSNLGPALVAAAVEREAGDRMDRYLRRTVFDPLCIGKTQWVTDPAGHAAGYTGLSISAFDLAKLGQLILNRGLWGSNRILSEDWVRMSALAASQKVASGVGLFWFMDWEPRYQLPVVVYHSGDGGQNLLIFPNHGIVVARLRASGYANQKQVMSNLGQLTAGFLIKRHR